MMHTQNKAIPGDAPCQPGVDVVLIVEDSAFQRHLLSAVLSQWGYRVLEAETGEDAIRQCRDCMPDLVISDWMMPGMSGPEFCRALRVLPGEDYAYFILLTSKSEKADVALGLDSGADDFLTKPVNHDELRARIAAGERILRMQRELTEKNRLIGETLGHMQRLHESIDRDLIEARKLQQSLLRERHRGFATGELSLLLRPSGHVGGDLVGFFPIGTDQVGLFAIDVSGHGISSALMTARLAGYLSATSSGHNMALQRLADGSHAPRPPAEVAGLLNDLVLGEMETEHYFTMIYGVIDLTCGAAVITQAGHPHPVLQRRDGEIRQIGTGGLPVGLFPGATFDQFEVQLHPGDRLLIASDGITECPDLAGRMLDDTGLEAFMRRARDTTGTAFLEEMVRALEDHAGGKDFTDDVSAILFDYTGPA